MSKIMVSGMILETDDVLPKNYVYNTSGKMTSASFVVLGKTFTQTYTYDVNGNLSGVSAWVQS